MKPITMLIIKFAMSLIEWAMAFDPPPTPKSRVTPRVTLGPFRKQ